MILHDSSPPYYQDAQTTIYHGDTLAILPTLPDASVGLILTDPPYFRVKMDQAWDRQWPTRDAYLAWLGQLAKEWQRILKPNGSLYCFASPQMAAYVEVLLGQYFTVLNRIRWIKDEGWHKKADKAMLRSFLSPWEEILFCEQLNSDSMALDESGYAAQCETLHAFVFEPIRTYLSSERDRAGWTTQRVAEEYQKKTGSRTVTGMAGHWFDEVQWGLPTPENYQWLKTLLNGHGVSVLKREYNELKREYNELKREYNELKREYNGLRRQFQLTARSSYTDVWDFATVPTGKNKHPCEKPLPLLRHIINVSSRPGDLVLDACCGSGNTLVAAKELGRISIGIDLEERWCRTTKEALSQEWLPLD